MSPQNPNPNPETLRTYLETHEVELTACSPDGTGHPHVTIPTPAGWIPVPNEVFPHAYAVLVAPEDTENEWTPNAVLLHGRLSRWRPTDELLRIAASDCRSLPEWSELHCRHRRLRFPSLGCHARRLPRRRCPVRRDNSISRRRRRIRPVPDPADGNHPRSPRSETGLRYIDYSQRVDSRAGYASPSGSIDARTRHGSYRGHTHPHLASALPPLQFCGRIGIHLWFPLRRIPRTRIAFGRRYRNPVVDNHQRHSLRVDITVGYSSTPASLRWD